MSTAKPIRILHTSDWHLGHTLYGRKRYEEHYALLQWLITTINTHKIELLLIAGDIFDSPTPSNKSLELYYQFLTAIKETCCEHVVIIGGNHDSPSLLEAPKNLLKHFNIQVVGSASSPEDEVLLLRDSEGNERFIVCAVPYLRDRDIRVTRAAETPDEKNSMRLELLVDHYRRVTEKALYYREVYSSSLPILATGHLFTTGGTTVEGDGVRELYVGSLAHVDSSSFPDEIDYLALGHLHSVQQAGRNPKHRYCGSPLAMSFSEAEKEKVVLSVTLEQGKQAMVTPLPVPCFQHLQTIQGDMEKIAKELSQLKDQKSSGWLEIIYDGKELISNLRSLLQNMIEDSQLVILRIANLRLLHQLSGDEKQQLDLDSLNEEEVFLRCLDTNQVSELQRKQLIQLFKQTLQEVKEEDSKAE